MWEVETFGSSYHLSRPVNSKKMLSHSEIYASSSAGNSFTRTSLACIPCRSRHVKCDAVKPRCTRCDTDGKRCYFVESKRGRKPKTCLLSTPSQATARKEPTSSSPHGIYNSHKSMTGSQSPSRPSTTSFSFSKDAPSVVLNQPRQAWSQGPFTKTSQDRFEKLVDHYYEYFHNPHPFLLPKKRMLYLFQTENVLFKDLRLVVAFVGSTYTATGQSPSGKQNATAALSRPDLPRNGYSIQALLLFAISTHCCNNFSYARQLLNRAINIAIDIELFSRNFALENGGGDPVCEESWRRTWWYLYVVDGWFAAIDRNDTFVLFNVETSVDLPCEERDYESEVCGFLALT